MNISRPTMAVLEAFASPAVVGETGCCAERNHVGQKDSHAKASVSARNCYRSEHQTKRGELSRRNPTRVRSSKLSSGADRRASYGASPWHHECISNCIGGKQSRPRLL